MIASKPILQPPAPHSRHKALALSPADCAAQLRAALAWRPGEWREVRVIGRNAPRKAVVSSPEEAASAIAGLEYGVGVFITVNPIANGADTAAKVGKNLVTAVRGSATSDAAIERRTRFVIDIDPVRPTATSATPEQLGEARALATTLSETLSLEGWPRPTMVTSGNGMHLYYSVDLEACSELPVRALQGLSARFGTTTVKVDTTVGNAARIMRVPGTWTAKGADRGLHRVALLETTGDDQPVTSGQLRNAGQLVNGSVDVRFTLWESDVGGTQIGNTNSFTNYPLTDGRFALGLNFGTGAFNGDQRWVQVEFRSPAGVGQYLTLNPRDKIMATPYALYALNGTASQWDYNPKTQSLTAAANVSKVGIGTTTPTAALEVVSATGGDDAVKLPAGSIGAAELSAGLGAVASFSPALSPETPSATRQFSTAQPGFVLVSGIVRGGYPYTPVAGPYSFSMRCF